MKLLISIILPVFNTDKYLQQSIESILNQTFTDFELIIIDDGSTDNSLKIIQSFDDNRIKIIQNQTNQGISTSLNKSIDLAQGKYIARMDADDISMPERLKKQVAFLEKNPTIDLVGSSVEFIDAYDNSKNSFDIRDYNQEMLDCLLIFTCPIYHPTIMCKSELLRQFKYDKFYEGLEDWELWTRIIETKNIINLPDVLLKYRLHEQNISRQKNLIVEQRLEKILAQQLEKYFKMTTQFSINIHLQTCANIQLSKKINASTIKRSEEWLRQLENLNTENKYFNTDIFNFALNLTWYNYIVRHINNGKWYFINSVFNSSFSLSFKQRMIILLKVIYASKFRLLILPFIQLYNFFKK
jgi:glycosyltransferase involved in cell wall biosynthesis